MISVYFLLDCNMQRTPQFGAKIRYFSKYPIIYKKEIWKLGIFYMKSQICEHNPIVK